MTSRSRMRHTIREDMKRAVQLVVLAVAALFAFEPVLAEALSAQLMRPACGNDTQCCGMPESSPATPAPRIDAAVLPSPAPEGCQDSTGCKPEACSYRVPQSVALLTAPAKSTLDKSAATPVEKEPATPWGAAPAPTPAKVHARHKYLLFRVFRI